MKKIFIIAGGVLGLTFIIILVYFAFIYKPEPQTPAANNSSSGPVKEKPAATVPSGVTITLKTDSGDVIVNNFISKAQKIIESYVYLKQTPGYSISYSTETSDFLIDLYGYDISQNENYRNSAETDIKKLLGVSNEDLCKLNIHTEVPPSYNSDLAGKDYGISFCSKGLKLSSQQ